MKGKKEATVDEAQTFVEKLDRLLGCEGAMVKSYVT